MNEKIATLQTKSQALGGSGRIYLHGNTSEGFSMLVDDFEGSGKTIDEAADVLETLLNEEAKGRIVRLKSQIDTIKAVWIA